MISNKKTDISPLLLTPEMSSHGGIQSYMRRVIDVCLQYTEQKPLAISAHDTNEEIAAVNLTKVVIGAGRNKPKFVWLALSLRRQPSVVITGLLGISPVGWILKKTKGINKHVIILHGIEAWRRASFFQRIAMHDADLIVATTIFTAKECAKKNNLSLDKFRILPLCADEKPRVLSERDYLKGEYKILCVGRMAMSEKHKGFEMLMESISLLIRKGINAKLYFIGDGEYRVRLEQHANKLGIAENVEFLGRVCEEKLQAAYASCDVFVMPSKKEGFGIVFLEAMRHGKPCIGGCHGGTPEVIKDGVTGYLVEWGDYHSLFEKLYTLYENVILRSSMGEESRKRYINNYTSEMFRRNLKHIIEE